MFVELFNSLIRKKKRVLRSFLVLWIVIGVIILLSAKSIFTNDSKSYAFWYDLALLSGKTALIFFVITLLPGIFNRFKIRSRFLGIIMIFRRQFGITMFLLALFHGLTVSVLPKFTTGNILNFLLFELFGLFSVILLFFLFITSNDFSQHKLGRFWYLLHRLVYIIMWLILAHVALQRLSVWSFIGGLLVISEMAGIIYSNINKNSETIVH